MNIKCGQRSISRFDISIADASCFAARFPGGFAKCFRGVVRSSEFLQPDLQPSPPSVPIPVSTRNGRIVRRKPVLRLS